MSDVDDGRGGHDGSGGARACAKESADDAMLRVRATEIMVEDGEERGRVDRERCRAGTFVCVRDVGNGSDDDDDLRVGIGECVRCILDEDRGRRRAQRHGVQNRAQSGVAIVLVFRRHAFRRDKGPLLLVLLRLYSFFARRNASSRSSSLVAYVAPCIARSSAHERTDRVALWLDPNDYIYWLY